MDTIKHYASFPATGVSLRQMVQFGENPSVGTSFHDHSGVANRLFEEFRLAWPLDPNDGFPDRY
jgi:pyruvate dehydrogenase kinase 2/3/4